MTEAEETALLKEWDALVWKSVNRWAGLEHLSPLYDEAERLSLCRLALLAAIRSWDPNRGKLGPHATILIEQKMSRVHRSLTQQKRAEGIRIPIDDPLLENYKEFACTSRERPDFTNALEAIKDKRHKQFIKLRMTHDNWGEVNKKLGISKQTAATWAKKLYPLLRAIINRG